MIARLPLPVEIGGKETVNQVRKRPSGLRVNPNTIHKMINLKPIYLYVAWNFYL